MQVASLTRKAAADEAVRLSRLADGAPAPASDMLWARANALVAEYDLDWIDCIRAPRTGHPLLLIAGGCLSVDTFELRMAICQHVRIEFERARHPGIDEDRLRSIAIGARWRRGSNSWRPNTMRILRDDREPETPCPNCGADGNLLSGQNGRETCPVCRTGFVVGDYAWDNLADLARYAADARAGAIEDNNRCRQCDRLYDSAIAAAHLGQHDPFCGVTGCPWGGDLALFDPFADPASDGSADEAPADQPNPIAVTDAPVAASQARPDGDLCPGRSTSLDRGA